MEQIDSKYDSILQNAIETQLRYQPTVKTRNRKPLQGESSIGATWELRCGPQNRLRIFYDVNTRADFVIILAITIKIRHKLMVGSEEFEL